jgi:ribosomal protein S18 acetylase RimI-like enzyme
MSLRIGVRVVVRRRLPDGSATDVVGTLLAADADALLVATGAGEVPVPVDDVIVAKAVPPRPSRRGPAHLALSVPDLEDVMADGWRAPDTAWLGRPGGWLLRAAEGFTGRGNSALPIGDPGMPPDAALAEVTAWYAARGLPPSVVLAEPLPPGDHARPPTSGLRAALEDAGWVERTPTLVMVAAARAVPPVGLSEDLTLTLADTPDDEWLALYRYRGQEVPPVGRALLVSAPQQAFASVRDAGRTVAVCRLAVSRAWGGITAMEVAPSHRRRGLARAVLSALAAASVRLGGISLYLQVAQENGAAQRLYAAAGFTVHHRYAYWSPPPVAGSGVRA